MTSRTRSHPRSAAIGEYIFRWANRLYRRWVIHRDKRHVRSLPDNLLDDVGLRRDTIDRTLATGHRPDARFPVDPRRRF